MNNKLKIKIKVDIIGPLNWTKDINIDYNTEIDRNQYSYLNQNLYPLKFNLQQIEAAVDNIEWMLGQLSTYGFKIKE